MENWELLMLLLIQQQMILMALLYNSMFRRREWVRDIFRDRQNLGEYNLVKNMESDPESFHAYFRMDKQTFDELLLKLGPFICKKDTNWRKSISPAERLAITLRYLATGDSQTTISLSYRVGHSTVSQIIMETCEAIWDVLMPIYLKPPSSQAEWKKIAKDFYEMWDFPMCVGAIDGKHIVIQAPGNSGSEYFNYKGSHSIVLLAVCNAQYCFTLIDVGDSGRHSDGGVFANSEFGKRFLVNELQIPKEDYLPNTDLLAPYCILGDAAFPLRHNLMRSYPGRGLPEEKRIFNYRLSRARRVIENTFGILATRWRIFRRPIIAEPSKAIAITKAACCLHNFLQIKNRQKLPQEKFYCSQSFVDQEDRLGNVIMGEWRSNIGQSNLQPLGRLGSNMYV